MDRRTFFGALGVTGVTLQAAYQTLADDRRKEGELMPVPPKNSVRGFWQGLTSILSSV